MLKLPPYRLLLSADPQGYIPYVHRAAVCRFELYVGSSWTSCLCSSMWKGPQEYITYELVATSSAVSCVSGSSNFDSFRYGW